MKKTNGVIQGLVSTTLSLAGAVPVGIIQGIAPRGSSVDNYISEHRDSIRKVVGAGVLAAFIF